MESLIILIQRVVSSIRLRDVDLFYEEARYRKKVKAHWATIYSPMQYWTFWPIIEAGVLFQQAEANADAESELR